MFELRDQSGTGTGGWWEQEPGPELAALLDTVDPGTLGGGEAVSVLVAAQRMVSHYQAKLYAAMVAVRDRYRTEDPDDELAWEGAAAEIAAALRLTRAAAREELSTAETLADVLPRLADTLGRGRLDLRRCRVVIDETRHLPDDTARLVVDKVLETAPTQTTGQLRAALRRVCLHVDPGGETERGRVAVDGRRFYTGPTPEGAGTIMVLDVDPLAAQAASDRIDQLARRLRHLPGEDRTLDQLRADVAVDLLCRGETSGTGTGVSATVVVHTDLTTLTRLDNEPGDLAGWGPVTADIARRVAAAPTRVHYEVTDPATGDIVAVGTTPRRPTTTMARLVQARHPHCVFPGCRMPAHRCDLDHRHPYASGGPTHEDNLTPLCRYHHHIRHHHHWTYTTHPDHTTTWISPLGHTYHTPPAAPPQLGGARGAGGGSLTGPPP